MLTSEMIKKIALEAGADKCGIAPISRMKGAPDDMNPMFLFPEAKSMIGFVFRIPRGLQRGIEEGTQFYQYPSMAYGGINEIFAPVVLYQVGKYIESEGYEAFVYRNTGNMKNHGFELMADYHSPQYGDFSWDGSFNFSLYRNEVEKLNDYVNYVGGDWRIIEGQPMGVYYGYVADGLFRTEEEVYNHADQQGKGLGRIKYRDLDGNGVIDENDRCVIGDPNPDFSIGLNLSFKYKQFTLSTFFTGEFGFDIYNMVKKKLDFMGTGLRDINHGADILNAWSEDNPNSSIPALALTDANNEQRMSTYFIEDGSYFKMKYIKLQYDLPSKLAKKFCQGLSIYGQVENVFTITGYSGLDPELPLSSYGARVDNSPYPRSRTFSIGINLQF